MTFINRLIAEAKAVPPPRDLTIRPNQVNALVQHAQGCMARAMTADQFATILTALQAGQLTMLGVPIRVLGSELE